MIDEAFAAIEENAVSDISDEEYSQFMSVYQKLYNNLLNMKDGQQPEL